MEQIMTINGIELTTTNDTIFTDSTTVAKVFEKQHKNLIKKIESDDAFNKFITELKIKPSEYIDSSGKTNKMYLLDRDAFSYYVMSFTGKEASKWKLKYIEAFNLMEKQLMQQPQIDVEKLATSITIGVTQALTTIIGNNQETELDKEKKRLEIENLKLDKINKIAELSKKYNLEELGNLNHIPSELNPQLKQVAGGVVKEVRPAINGISPTACLKQSDLDIRVNEFYQLLNKANIVEYYEYPDYRRGTILKWKITDRGRYYGYNQHSSSIKELPYQVKLYYDRFGELLDYLRSEELLTEQGE